MRWYHWVLIAVIAVFAADWAWAHYEIWRKKRDEFIKYERLNRFNVAAFRGARKFDDPRWPT